MTCRYFGISRSAFYQRKISHSIHGKQDLNISISCPYNPALLIPKKIEDKILYLRRKYLLGQKRIAWFLDRYYGIKFHQAACIRSSSETT